MKAHSERFSRFALAVVVLVVFVPLLQWVRAQGRGTPVHLTTDWSNRHLVFSQPRSLPDSWRLRNEPRYGHQWLRRNEVAIRDAAIQERGGSSQIRDDRNDGRGGNDLDPVRPGGPFRPVRPAPPTSDFQPLRTDWGVSMQAAGTSGTEMFPAKFNFDVNSAPDCTNDFIVYNSGLASAAPVKATRTATFAGSPANSTFGTPQTFTIADGAPSITWYANSGALTSASATITVNTQPAGGDTVTVGGTTYTYDTVAPTLANHIFRGATAAIAAQNLQATINANNGQCNASGCFGAGTLANTAASAGLGGAVVTVTAPVAGAANNFAVAMVSTHITLGATVVAGGTNNGAGSSVFPNYLVSATNTNATNLANSIAANGAPVGVTGSSTGLSGVVTITALDGGTDGNLIALTKVNMAQLTLGGATLAGGAGQSSIFALNNLYSTQGSVGGLCNSNGPTLMWSYQTSTLATKGGAVTSPVISGDGAKVAYVETSVSGAVLHILKWKTGQGAGVGDAPAPDQTLAALANWNTCTVGNSCIVNITFNGGAADQDTNSSPFYNYNTDIIYIGDNNGKLHKFTGVFLGAPQEVTSGGWPIAVAAAAVHLSSPVMDNGSVNIFVGANNGTLSYVKEVGSVTGTCSGGGNATPCLGLSLGATVGAVTTINVATGASSTSNGTAASGAVTDAPIVDGSIGVLFVSNGTETGANHGTMIETNTALGSSVVGQVIANQRVGGNSGPPNASPVHTGAFDNAYLNSAGGTGSFYVCGAEQIVGHNSRPAIYKFTLTNGVMTVVPSGTTTNELLGLASNSSDECSPVTEVENPNAAGGAKEWIFFSFGNNANNGVANGGTGLPNAIPAGSPCATDQRGCLASIDITSGVWPPASGTVTNTISLPANGVGASTTGIIVDNVASPGSAAQASSIYFTLTVNSAAGTGAPGLPQCNGHNGVGCAVKLTQAALQ
jgi:hypothetical protein